jgi:hypothetical protein
MKLQNFFLMCIHKQQRQYLFIMLFMYFEQYIAKLGVGQLRCHHIIIPILHVSL